MTSLPAEVETALMYFQQQHDPAGAPFGMLGTADQGLLIYVPSGLPALNIQTLADAVNVALEHPDRMAEFLIDLEARA